MINVIGIGLDGVSGLTENVKDIIEEATLLVGSERHLSYFPNHRVPQIILKDIGQTFTEIQNYLAQEKIVILVSGDPLFFGLGRLLLEKFPANLLQFYPHLNSVQLAFNRIKVPWQDAQVVSVHGRSLEELNQLLQRGTSKIAVLTDSINNPPAIAQFYLSLDIPINYDFWICENLEGETEKITHFPLPEVAILSRLTDNHFSPLNIVILLRQEPATLNLENLPLFGIDDRAFLSFSDHPGLMTKREIRIMILGELKLQSKQIIWDIGAGTGTVSIEIARLCSKSQIYAIEKTIMGIHLIEQNCRRFEVENIIPIYGKAPSILQNLPSPERIFIGGSGGNIEEILTMCATKISTQGIIVLALATLENLQQSMIWLTQNNWQYKLLQLNLSRSVSVSKLTRFSPLNPVTILTASRA